MLSNNLILLLCVASLPSTCPSCARDLPRAVLRDGAHYTPSEEELKQREFTELRLLEELKPPTALRLFDTAKEAAAKEFGLSARQLSVYHACKLPGGDQWGVLLRGNFAPPGSYFISVTVFRDSSVRIEPIE